MTEQKVSTAERIRAALRQAQAKIQAAENERHEPIAIVGMACRFPGGADSPEAFWQRLLVGADLTREIPEDRWQDMNLYDPDPGQNGKIYVRRGGFLDRVDQFDPEFFHISPREAERMDPQHRLVLEVGYEALQACKTRGERTGVYLGLGQNDYAQRRLYSSDPSQVEAYDGTGNLSCFAAGRLAFCLGAMGPNLVVDTACSSSLVAIHLACRALRARECDSALAGGVHLVLSHEVTLFLCRTGALSPNGVCRTFDAEADGFVRGEGCGMLVLKRLSDAVADGDHIHAVIRGSAVNHDGAGGGLTVPNEQAQIELVREAMKQARVSAEEIGYIEAHGTGTSLGDPIEVSALAAAFQDRGRKPLPIASVKTNMGHLEAAAGVAGIIKTILMMKHGHIVPHLHFENPNPRIDWERLPFTVPVQGTPWQDGAKLAGISSFGMSGTNAHIILGEAPADNPPAKATTPISWKRETYRVKTSNMRPPAMADQTSGEPLIGGPVRLPFSAHRRYENRISLESLPFLEDHKVFDRYVVPGAFHVAAMLTAAREHLGVQAVTLRDVMFRRALVLEPGKARYLQFILERESDRVTGLRLISRDCNGKDEEWVEHMTAFAVPANGETPERLTSPDLGDDHDGDTLYEQLLNAGFDLGPNFQWNGGFRRNQSDTSCRIQRPDVVPIDAPYLVHPGLLDTCFQMNSLFWETPPADLADKSYLFVPFRIASLTLYDQVPNDGSLTCIGRHRGPRDNGLQLIDNQDRILIHVKGFEFRRAERRSLFKRRVKEPVYRPIWSARDTPKQSGKSGPVLVVDNGSALGDRLVDALQTKGYQWARMQMAPDLAQSGDTHFRADLLNPNHLQAFFKDNPHFSEILFLVDQAGLDAEDEDNLSAVFQEEIQVNAAALNLIQCVLQQDQKPLPRLNLVTNTQIAHIHKPATFYPIGAGLWGLGATLQLEHPNLRCKRIDVDGDPQQQCRQLIAELEGLKEDQVAYRDEQRYVRRLIDVGDEIGNFEANFMIRPDGVYLITGGLGALGLRLARALVELGAGRLILNGRGEADEAARAAIGVMRDAGTEIRFYQGDISEAGHARACLDLARSLGAPLRGIFHAAGVHRDGAILSLNDEALAEVMRSKVAATLNLHHFSLHDNLDHFVCFSSTAALLGSRGQGNYAAANAFMDTLMHYRRLLGLPALSVNWGAWAKIGMAQKLDQSVKTRLFEQGLGALDPDQGFAILAKLMQTDWEQAMVQELDWTRFPRNFYSGEPPALLADIKISSRGQARLSQPARRRANLFSAWSSLPKDEQKARLQRFLQERIAAVLKVKDPDRISPRKPLFDAGLDSIMAIELQQDLERALGRDLRQTLVFDFPSVEAMAGHLGELMGLAGGTQPESRDEREQSPDTTLGALLDEVRQTEDDELLARLREG